MLREDIIASRIVFAWQKNKKVERTAPGSKNKYKITYLDGQEKWTSDYPGDGRGSNRDKRLSERKQSRPSIKDATEKLGSAVKAYVDGGDKAAVVAAVDATIVHLGREVARETIGKFLKGEAEGKAKEAHGIMRERVNEKLRKKQASSWYYGWMDEDGKFYRVAFGAHESFARRQLNSRELKMLGDYGASEALYDKGWVRVVPYGSDALSAGTWNGKVLNNTQLRELTDMAIENGMTQVYLDNGRAFKVVWSDEKEMVASEKESTMNDRVNRIASNVVANITARSKTAGIREDITGLLAVRRQIDDLKKNFDNFAWSSIDSINHAEDGGVKIGKDSDAIYQYLDNAAGRISTLIVRLWRIKDWKPE